MKKLKRFDIILIISLLFVSLALFIIFGLIKKQGNRVIIKQNNAVVYRGELSNNREISLKHNTVKIKNGEVFMQSADCKNQICVKTGKISKSGETIICLPNKVIVEIE